MIIVSVAFSTPVDQRGGYMHYQWLQKQFVLFIQPLMQIALQDSCYIFFINVTLDDNFTAECGFFFRFFYETEEWFHSQNE